VSVDLTAASFSSERLRRAARADVAVGEAAWVAVVAREADRFSRRPRLRLR
jgi:hypothetical protein